jgi:hypothetical protein
VCEAADDAPWRSQRLTTQQLLEREWNRGKRVSPIFSVFGIFNHLFKCDWLHCGDHGVSADFLGNEFDYLVDHKMPGASKAARCAALGEHMNNYYATNGVEDRLKEFLPKTYAADKSTRPPRLKGNAASTRALVKFGHLMAQQFLSDDVPIEHAIKTAAHHLLNCYNSLHLQNRAFSHASLYESSKIFAVQYGALWQAHGQRVSWRPMPKMHLFLELCSEGTEPEKFWNYRDEDFGGSVARQSRMKGRWKKTSAFCKHGLDLFKMKNKAPRIVRDTFAKRCHARKIMHRACMHLLRAMRPFLIQRHMRATALIKMIGGRRHSGCGATASPGPPGGTSPFKGT